ncbi:MAG TPA: peptidoglycan-binding protein [Bacillales bacterium]|nr:peptidoglycan-binding protein [Bacillales bacterium]
MPMLPTLHPGMTGHYVRRLQMGLNGLALNYNGFRISGFYDQKTKEAVQNFQDRFKLPRDGIVGPMTWRLLLNNVMAVQSLLNARGYHAGTVDGWYGPKTTRAVTTFQRDNRLNQSGIVEPRTRQRLFNPHPRDNYEFRPSSRALNSLDPYVAAKARRFLQLTQANGLHVHVTNAFRSWDEQDRLFAMGRTQPGRIVTNARGGDSFHNWGLAFDAAPLENGTVSNDIDKYKRMGRLGQRVGLEWGGTFKSIVDYPHFQYTFGLNTWDLLDGVRTPR